MRSRFEATQGLDPIFRTNDGSNSPWADVTTLQARRGATGLQIYVPLEQGAYTYAEARAFVGASTQYCAACVGLTDGLLTSEGVSTVEGPGGRTLLQVEPEALRTLTETAMHDIAHYLRPAHLAQLRKIIDDPESSGNDRFVALDLLKNVNISAGGVLPMCQDTGTAIVMGKKSEGVLTGVDDAEAISRGVYDAYTKLNLRYSQLAPLTTWEEKNTGTNLPAQIELYADTVRNLGTFDPYLREMHIGLGCAVENMTRAPYLVPSGRFGARMGDTQMIDSTHIKAHRSASGAKGGEEAGYWPLARRARKFACSISVR